MASILQIKDLKARKRALVAEAEVYRQTLSLEVHNLRLCGVRMRRQVTGWTSHPLVKLAPLALGLLRFRRSRRSSGLLGAFRAGLLLWQTYRKLAPSLWQMVGNQMRRSASNGDARDMEPQPSSSASQSSESYHPAGRGPASHGAGGPEHHGGDPREDRNP